MTRRQLAKQDELSNSPCVAVPSTALEPEFTADNAVEPEPMLREEPTNTCTQQHASSNVQESEPCATTGTTESPILQVMARSEETQVYNGYDVQTVVRTSALGCGTGDDIAEQQSEASLSSAQVNETSETEPEPKTLTAEKPGGSGITTPDVHSSPLSRSPARSPMRLEESFGAIDALEEALENVIPSFPPALENKSPQKTSFARDARPRPTSMIEESRLRTSSQIKSLRPPSIPPRNSLMGPSSNRATSNKEAREARGGVTDYLATKRRPISMQFPTPPPPQRTSKAPTKATFQLSSDVVAAKLKVQKEERIKRAQAGQLHLPSVASIAPTIKSSKPPTRSTFQLSSEATAARLKAQKEERLKRMAGDGIERSASTMYQPPLAPKSIKLPTVPSFQLPGDIVAAKLKIQRKERVKREDEAAKPPIFKARPAPMRPSGLSTVRQTAASRAREQLQSGDNTVAGVKRMSSVNGSKRKSTTLASSHASSLKRNSILISLPTNNAPLRATDAATQRTKGREIFNRDKNENEQRERERREKEEAAKRARAEAAERSRVLSRQWAEKQRQKAMGAKAPRVESQAVQLST